MSSHGTGHGAGFVIARRATSVTRATGTTQLIVYEADLNPGDRLQVRARHGFADQVRADVAFAGELGDEERRLAW